MKFIKTKIPDCYEIRPNLLKDERGIFVKTFYEPIFKEKGLETNFTEQFYSLSNKHVLRGLHFQTPPMEQTKLIYCLVGKIFDVVVDLRIGSPSYGQFESFQLDSENGTMVYIPNGLAHGFYCLSKEAIVVYNATNIYSTNHDSGIHWDSLDIPWPTASPMLSNKDEQLIPFSNFKSPFNFEGGEKTNEK